MSSHPSWPPVVDCFSRSGYRSSPRRGRCTYCAISTFRHWGGFSMLLLRPKHTLSSNVEMSKLQSGSVNDREVERPVAGRDSRAVYWQTLCIGTESPPLTGPWVDPPASAAILFISLNETPASA